MQLTELQQFRTNKKQKATLRTLRDKYCMNTSEFIRDAINEKLIREKDTIFKNYREIQAYLAKYSEVPF